MQMQRNQAGGARIVRFADDLHDARASDRSVERRSENFSDDDIAVFGFARVIRIDDIVLMQTAVDGNDASAFARCRVKHADDAFGFGGQAANHRAVKELFALWSQFQQNQIPFGGGRAQTSQIGDQNLRFRRRFVPNQRARDQFAVRIRSRDFTLTIFGQTIDRKRFFTRRKVDFPRCFQFFEHVLQLCPVVAFDVKGAGDFAFADAGVFI